MTTTARRGTQQRPRGVSKPGSTPAAATIRVPLRIERALTAKITRFLDDMNMRNVEREHRADMRGVRE